MRLGFGLVRVLLITLAIPAVGYLVSVWIINDVNTYLAKEGIPPIETTCSMSEALADPDITAFCDEFTPIALLGDASLAAGIIGIAIPIVYWIASIFAGRSRRRIAVIFPPLVTISIFTISILVLLHGAILTYAAYIGESYAIERVHFILIGGIGLGAVVVAKSLIGASFKIRQKLTTQAIGKSLSETEAPNLFSFVNELAERLGANPPRNIIVGLDPTFYVTSCDVAVVGEQNTLSGETLYVSAPLSRLMSRDELASIVGHELGHFRGEDTVYNLRFAPVYAGLGSAIGAMEGGDEGASGIATIPALAILSFMYEVFARNEATIGRERELMADEAGAEASSPLALATSLVKVSLYSGFWPQAQEQNIERLNEGKITRNLSKVFQDSTKYDVANENIDDILDGVMEIMIPHPTDTHPSVGIRLNALGIERSQITKDMLLIPGDSAIELIDNFEEIEEEATMFEHNLMVALGQVEAPEDDEKEQNYLLHATYCLAAAMVAADGKIESEEIAVAEAIGKGLFQDFDPVDFRERCNNPDDIPDVEKLTEIIGAMVTEEGKALILKYLKAISESDQDVDEKETALLQTVAENWNIDLSSIEEETQREG